jgi:hypothetical protein
MSTTIGIGYSTYDKDRDDFFSQLIPAANKFGYGLLHGINYAEKDVRRGLEIAQRNQGWDQVLFLQSPINGEVSLAFGIHEELTKFQMFGTHPKFFNFLLELSELGSQKCIKLGVFFSGDWYENDPARYNDGSIDKLISLLSMTSHWGIIYLIPKTGHLQFSDESPLVFDLKLRRAIADLP